MIDWKRWLPGMPDDEDEDPVSKALRTLQQGASDVGAGIGAAASSAGEALGSAAQTASSYLPQVPSVLPEPVDPSRWAQPRRADGEPSTAERIGDVASGLGRGVAEGAAAGAAAADPYITGPARTMPSWEDPLAPVREVAQHVAQHPLSTVPFFQYGDIQQAATEPIGRRAVEAAGGGTDPLFRATIPESVPLVGGTEIAPSAQDVGGAVSSAVLDPLNLLGAGGAAAAGRGGRAIAAEAIRGLPLVGETEALVKGGSALARRGASALGEALGRNAENVAAADARMAAEGSTMAPAGLGALPAPDPRRGVPTVEAISDQLDAARDAVRAAREAGDEAREQAAGEHMWALEDQMVDALNARRALEPRITSDMGRRVESLPLAEETADTLSGAGSRRERVAPGDLGVPMSQAPPSISLNAALGMMPDQGGAAAARRADEIRAAGGPASSVKKWDSLAHAGVDTKEELADTLRTVPMVTAQQARAMLGDRPDYLEPVADFLLQQRKKALDGAMTARDVAKAYYMTLMSMRSSAQEAGALEGKLGRGFVTGAGEAVPPNPQLADLDGLVNVNNGRPLGPIFTEANPRHGGREVRPESAGAAWLWTDEGQRALNGMSEGEFIPEAWESGRHARLAFGSDTVGGNGALRPLTAAEIRAGKVNMTNLPQFVDELNAGIASMRRAGRESEIGPWLTDQAKRLNGISTGKSAFIKQLLGFGDSVTIDAREINYWLSGTGLLGKGDTSRGAQLARASGQWWDSDVVSGALQPRIQQEVMRLRNAHPELLEGIAPEDAAHILHHWIWDKAGGSATRHTDVMASQQLAGSAGALPAMRGAGALASVNRALGEGLAGGVGGAVIEQGRNPDEDPRTAAARGFAVGAVGFPAATSLARGAARLAGAGEAGAGTRLASALGAVPGGAERRATLSAAGQDVMDTYARETPARTAEATRRAVDTVSTQLTKMGADPEAARAVVEATRDAIERQLAGTKVVATGLRPGALNAYLRGGGLGSKTEAGDLGQIVEITRQQINAAGKRLAKQPDGTLKAAPYTTAEAENFVRRQQLEHDMVMGGHRFPDASGVRDTTAPNTLYAYVSDGQPLIGPNSPTVWGVWHPDTPRVTSPHHPFALGSPEQDIHAKMPEGYKQTLWSKGPEDAIRDARTTIDPTDGQPIITDYGKVPTAGGRGVADTPFLVDQSGEDAMRANGLLLSIPDPLRRRMARGEVDDPEQLASVLLRGGGVRNREYRGFGASQSATRSESIIADPHPANLQAIYIAGPEGTLERQVPNVPNAAGKTGMTTLETAQAVRAKIKAETGNDVPIYYKNTSAPGGSKLIGDAQLIEGPPIQGGIAPGRAGVVGRYTQEIDPKTKAPYADLGSGLLARHGADLGNAAQGAVLGAASEDLQAQAEGRDADPNARLARGALGAGLGYVAVRGVRGLGRAGEAGLGSGVVPTRRAAAAAAAGTPAAAAAPDLSATLAKIPGLRRAFGGAEARAAAMKAAGRDAPSAWEWMKQAGYAGIYGPATAVNSAIGGAQELLLAQPKEAVRALVEGRPVVSRGAVARQAGAARDGLAGLGKVLLGDAGAAAGVSGGSQGTAGLSERVANPIGHLAARLLERPGEVLTEAPDALFRPAFLAQGEEREAQRIAKEAGFTGDKAASFVDTLLESAQHLKANPNTRSTSDQARRVVEAGKQYADQLGYKGEPGKLGKYLADLSKRDDGIGVLASFLMPFPSMASRMTTAAARSTPGVGLLPAFRKGQSTFDTVYDQAFGSLVAAGIAGWAYEGGITGSGPDDPEKRAELQAQGWQPNSVLVAGHYVPTRAFGRFQPMLDAAGEIHDSATYQKPGDKKALVLDLAKRAGSLATDQVGLSGLADLYDMFVNDKGATFPGWAARSAMRYVPGGGILRAAAAAADPQARRPERWAKDETVPTTAIVQNLETAIPGLRQNVPAAQDVLGRPAPNPQRGLGAVVPRTTTQRDDPLIGAYLDAGVDISSPPAAVDDVELTPAQQRRYREVVGQQLARLAGPVVGRPTWAQTPPAVKKQLLETYLETARALAESATTTEGGADFARRRSAAMLEKAKSGR